MNGAGKIGRWRYLAVVIGIGLTASAMAADPGNPAEPKKNGGQAQTEPGAKAEVDPAVGEAVFAHVGDQVITVREYETSVADAVRKKFYHGVPPKDDVAALRREVGSNAVDNLLIFQEAVRRGIKPDAEAVQRAAAAYDERYASSPQWQQNRELMLPKLTGVLERQSRMSRLHDQILNEVPAPDDEATQAYYQAHPEKFTEPEQVHVRSILLRVDASATKETWLQVKQEAQALVKRLADGADFAEQARIQSAGPEAKNGGDMGWVHKGELAPKMQEIIDKLKPGATSEPFPVLEGVAIVRVEERKPALPMKFADVQKRASALLLQEKRYLAWRTFVASLRQATTIQIDESRYVAAEPSMKKE